MLPQWLYARHLQHLRAPFCATPCTDGLTKRPLTCLRPCPGCSRPQVLSEANVKALRESVQTLSKTLGHIERITGDLGGITSDKRVTGNLKQLIEALSRLVAD